MGKLNVFNATTQCKHNSSWTKWLSTLLTPLVIWILCKLPIMASINQAMGHYYLCLLRNITHKNGISLHKLGPSSTKHGSTFNLFLVYFLQQQLLFLNWVTPIGKAQSSADEHKCVGFKFQIEKHFCILLIILKR